ncbi:DUF1127 domain-containing protein [Gymnodinialimonas ceratoperidinii]|uniref:DUF1127 domain-containing protein n=1 Tax=Gymnodinialimonas ceratoperidinii TaxID=2856823 RepID=A0A8F6TWC7_9RHOB|nr:DUF1127 domain-containing protein [Gymnodinialimonas ceratoperidinii]QXT39138.1 DUF1127 domain-containing protein [Gymnodinialimonas ceratoperidinii]
MAHLPLSRPQHASFGATAAACAPKANLSLFARVIAVWRERQHLNRLPEHMRRDIGLSDAQIARETQRPLWDAPQAWRR